MTQPQTHWSDDGRCWWNDSQWRPATEFRVSPPPPTVAAAPLTGSAKLAPWIGESLALMLVVSIVEAIGAHQGQNPISSDSGTLTAQGTGKNSSEIFTLADQVGGQTMIQSVLDAAEEMSQWTTPAS